MLMSPLILLLGATTKFCVFGSHLPRRWFYHLSRFYLFCLFRSLSLSLWALWTYLVISNSSHFVFCFPFFLVAIRLYQLYYRNGAAEWQNQRKLVQNQNGFKRTKYKMRPKRRREKEIRHKIIRKSTSKMKNRRSSLVLVWQLSNDTTDGNQNIKISTE